MTIKFSTAHDNIDLALDRLFVASYPEDYLKVYLKDNSASDETSCTTLRPRTTQGNQFTGTPKPDNRTSQSSLLLFNTADKVDPVFADRQSGVIFTSGLVRASGDSVKVREFCKARGLAPTLHLVIPSASDSVAVAPTSATNIEQQAATSSNGRESSTVYCPPGPFPTFALTLASPTTTPQSPIHYPTSVQRTFSRLSYFKEVNRAPRHMRIPHLPQYCAHTLRPFVPLTKCALCEIQILACETWWNSRHHDNMATATAAGLKRLLCVPQVLPADCTPTTRSILRAWTSAWRA
ncbi:hypothetical protein F5888DRAFT_1636916 [Russula emetica]|nr:hypothetical protein F5888DRAFT_1636916 [Russula emetica]